MSNKTPAGIVRRAPKIEDATVARKAQNEKIDVAESVTCESCHGPGRDCKPK